MVPFHKIDVGRTFKMQVGGILIEFLKVGVNQALDTDVNTIEFAPSELVMPFAYTKVPRERI
jgi:hypothetical protein